MSMNFFWACCLGLVFFVSCGKKNNEKLADTYFRMGFLEMSGDCQTDLAYKRALGSIDKALAYSAKPEYYAFKGTLLFKLGDYHHSEESFKKALALAPSQDLRAEIMNNYACLLAHRGQLVQAQAIWKALGEDTAYQTPEVAWVNLGKTYVGAKDFVGARDVFARAVHLSPSYIDAHYYLASAAAELGDRELVQRELDIVLALEPEHYGAQRLASVCS